MTCFHGAGANHRKRELLKYGNKEIYMYGKYNFETFVHHLQSQVAFYCFMVVGSVLFQLDKDLDSLDNWSG